MIDLPTKGEFPCDSDWVDSRGYPTGQILMPHTDLLPKLRFLLSLYTHPHTTAPHLQQPQWYRVQQSTRMLHHSRRQLSLLNSLH